MCQELKSGRVLTVLARVDFCEDALEVEVCDPVEASRRRGIGDRGAISHVHSHDGWWSNEGAMRPQAGHDLVVSSP